MDYSLITISEEDRREVIDIFNYFVVNSWAAYIEEPVGDHFFDYILDASRNYPALTVKDDTGTVVGFGFLRPYHPAKSFGRTAEATYFIKPDHTRKGLGTEIMERLFSEARKKGIDSVLASVSSRNEASLSFHLKKGFQECGRFRRIGRKFGQDFDVVWMQRRIAND